jgi:serine/threonine protein kinase
MSTLPVDLGKPFASTGYVFMTKLGDGATSRVSLYWGESCGFLAVKEYLPVAFRGPGGGPDARRRELFNRDVTITISLEHPATPRIFGYGTPGQSLDFDPWIAMQFFPGGTLCDLISIRRCEDESGTAPLTVTESMIVLYGVSDVLRNLHVEKKSVHRDVKTLNIFLDKDNEPFLGDFGFARPLGPSMTGKTYSLIYAAPELMVSADSLEYDAAVDVWAFGMLIYEIRTGRPPYLPDGGTIPVAEIPGLICNPAKRPSLDPGDPFRPLYMHCVEMRPSDRWPISRVHQWLAGTGRAISGLDVGRFDAYAQKLRAPLAPAELPSVHDIAVLAQSGGILASFVCGVLLLQGLGNLVPQDPVDAADWLRQAANFGHREAVNILQLLLERRPDLAIDPGEREAFLVILRRIDTEMDAVGPGFHGRVSQAARSASREEPAV